MAAILSRPQYVNSHPEWDHKWNHYSDVIMDVIASQITSLTIVYSTVYSDADQRKHQSSASLAFVREIQRWPVNSPHKGPVPRKMFPFDDVIMETFMASHTLCRINHWALSLVEVMACPTAIPEAMITYHPLDPPGTPFTNKDYL